MASGDVTKWAMDGLGTAYEYKSEQKTLADIQDIAATGKQGGRGWQNYLRGCANQKKDPLDPSGGPSIKDEIDTANEKFLKEKLEEIKAIETTPVIVETDLDYEQETQNAIEKAMEEREKEIREGVRTEELEEIPPIEEEVRDVAERARDIREELGEIVSPDQESIVERQVGMLERVLDENRERLEDLRAAGASKSAINRIQGLIDVAESQLGRIR